MSNYTVYFEIFGKKMRHDVEATSEADAKRKVAEKIVYREVVEHREGDLSELLPSFEISCENKYDDEGLHKILCDVSEASGVTIEQIAGRSRKRKVRTARQVYFYAARLKKRWKDCQIGDAIGYDRCTVIHSYGVVKTTLGMKRPEPEYAALANRLGIVVTSP